MGQAKEAKEYFRKSNIEILKGRFMVGTCKQCGTEYANKTAYNSSFRNMAEDCGLPGPGHVAGYCEHCSREPQRIEQITVPLEVLSMRMEILSDALVRTLLALEVAYQYKDAMPEHVQTLIEQRIDDARESC